jgi:hypothetical protein
MNDTNIDTHKSLFRRLHEKNTSYPHTHRIFYIKTEPTIRNIQNSYTLHQRITNIPTKCNTITTVIKQPYITKYSVHKQNANINHYNTVVFARQRDSNLWIPDLVYRFIGLYQL